jgi:hypothetical protein
VTASLTVSPTAAVRRWLFSPLDTAPIAALRIACGLLVIGWTLSLLPDVNAFLSDDGLTRSAVHGTRGWWTVDLVWPWAAVGLLFVAAVALLVGWHTRVAAVLVWLLLIAVQRRDVYMLNSGDLLLRELAFYLSLMPAGEVWSLDARRRGSSSPRAPWGLRLLQVQVSLLYLFSVVAKLHGDTWQDGSAVGRAVQLADLQRFLVPQSIATSVTASALLTYGTLVVEGALVFGLWLPRFRWVVMAAGLSIHLGIEATLLIGWFSLTVISCYLAFVPPETLRAAVAAVHARVRREPAAPVPVPQPVLVSAAAPVLPPPTQTVVVPPSAASSYRVGSVGQQQRDEPGEGSQVGLPAGEHVGVDEGHRQPDDGVGHLVEGQPEREVVPVVDEQLLDPVHDVGLDAAPVVGEQPEGDPGVDLHGPAQPGVLGGEPGVRGDDGEAPGPPAGPPRHP